MWASLLCVIHLLWRTTIVDRFIIYVLLFCVALLCCAAFIIEVDEKSNDLWLIRLKIKSIVGQAYSSLPSASYLTFIKPVTPRP